MKPAAFRYFAPETLDEALSLLGEHGDEAKPLAGGQSLVPAMNFRLAQPAILVDLNRIADLAFIRPDDAGGPGSGVVIGAMTRQRVVEHSELVAARAPLVTETVPHIAHAQIRNRGTFGGSLAHADPASELPAVALALDAQFTLACVGGQRVVTAESFYTDLFETACQHEELLVDIRLPAPAAGSGFAFEELARRHGDYALVGVAAAVARGADGALADARLAYLSVGPGPVLATRASASLVGTRGEPEALRAAAALAAHEDIVDPPSDIHATAAYRRHLIEVLTIRVLKRATARATHRER